ncbi:hypothetical protein [Georgenia subflava]|nr:hypothetical protein [Georgenia subflava]
MNRSDRKLKPCMQNLGSVEPGLQLPPHLLDLQARILDAKATRSRSWWSDLTMLSRYALLTLPTGAPRELATGRVPAAIEGAWDSTCAERDRLRRERRAKVPGALYRPPAETYRLARVPPADTALMAATTLLAYSALTNERALVTFVDLARQDTTRLSERKLRIYGATPELSRRTATAVEELRYGRSLDYGRLRPTQPKLLWNAANVPPLLWADLFEKHLAPLVVDMPISTTAMRRFASIALYRERTQCLWSEATAHFFDDVFRNRTLAFGVRYHVAAGFGVARLHEILNAIDRVSEELNSDGRIDAYPTMRAAATEAFAEPVTADVFQFVANGAQRATVPRCRWAAVWAWTMVASDHLLNAPAWTNGRTRNERDNYLIWVKRAPTPVLEALQEWAQLEALKFQERGGLAVRGCEGEKAHRTFGSDGASTSRG